jgi:predicted HicB family RNase H-like nuclease
MIADSKADTVRVLDRINLRLSPQTFAAIDASRATRLGTVSRNTWITEAVEEKLARDRTSAARPDQDQPAHG